MATAMPDGSGLNICQDATFDWPDGTHVVVGGAGFLGSHICEAILGRGGRVVCIDSLVTGSLENLDGLLGSDRFSFLRGDGVDRIAALRRDDPGRIVVVWSLAALASPMAYATRPMETLWAGAEVHRACLELAADHGARIVYTSTSEVYGDPEIHPQPESYRGSVDPTGPRSQYDESKRFGEAMAMAYMRTMGLDVRIARLFNTYGPRMAEDDGRLVPSFLKAAIMGAPLQVQGDGLQTRSLCYVDDVVEALMRLCALDRAAMPARPVVNIGSDDERTVLHIARQCQASARRAKPPLQLRDGDLQIQHASAAPDDPRRRRPDISLASALLSGWTPTTTLDFGMYKTVEWLRPRLMRKARACPAAEDRPIRHSIHLAKGGEL